MKKIQLIILVLLTGASIIITSCNKDKNTTPTMNFIGGTVYTSANASVTAGDSITVGVNAAKGPDGSNLVEYKVERVYNNVVSTAYDDKTLSTANFSKTLKFKSQTVAGTEKFKFEVYDKDGNTTEIEFNITTTSPVTYGQINSWSGKVLGDQYQTPGSWLASSTGTVYDGTTISANASSADIFYRNIAGATQEAFISYADCQSIDANAPAPATGATTTYFGTTSITTTAFDALHNDSLIKDIPPMTTKYVNITGAGVYAFINAANKKGLIKVTAIDATSGTGSITISVKVQH